MASLRVFLGAMAEGTALTLSIRQQVNQISVHLLTKDLTTGSLLLLPQVRIQDKHLELIPAGGSVSIP